MQFAGFDQWLRNTRLTGSVEKYEGDGPYQNFGSDVHVAVLFNGHFDMADQLKDHVQDADMHGSISNRTARLLRCEWPHAFWLSERSLRLVSRSPRNSPQAPASTNGLWSSVFWRLFAIVLLCPG